MTHPVSFLGSGQDRPNAALPPTDDLQQLVTWLGEGLRADRCFLYVRQPDQQHGRIAFQWRRSADIPDVIQPNWQADTGDLPAEDPLFRAALTGKPSVFVNDVETASPDVVNYAFEAKTFGHRALIHAHLFEGGQLWAILQPCIFGQPRIWTGEERSAIEELPPVWLPVVKAWSNSQ